MAMTGSGLAAAFTAVPGIVITDSASLLAFCNALVQYIQDNADVTAVVTSGAGSGGSVVGTAPTAIA